MNINVINKTMWAEPVTVQRKEYGEVVFCNHANHTIERVESVMYRPDSADAVWYTTVLTCDKCPAYAREGEGWEDAPSEGLHERI